jgi:membrane protease subunit (stomatin/prohibitin family)
MARKTVGHVQLEWTCPRCTTRNPGPQKFCNGCGGPQPADVAFEQPAQEQLITDAAELARAKAGPDVHCPYCQNRNTAGSKFCGSCGGDLAGAQARKGGQVLGAHRAGPVADVKCPSCGTANPGTATRCKQCGAALAKLEIPKSAAPIGAPAIAVKGPPIGLWIGLGVVLLCILGIVGALLIGGRSKTLQATVSSVRWERSIAIEGLVAVERQAWQDEVPSSAELLGCRSQMRGTSSEPVAGAQEVCGTPYTVDSGGGYGEVVQDCVYEVYDQFCSYRALDWQVITTPSLSGSDLSPEWPSVSLATDQRRGAEHESYSVVLEAGGDTYTYSPDDAQAYQAFSPGSVWDLQVNGFGSIVDLQPAG